MSNLPNFREISENFEFLDDWEDRYRYLIEIGQMLSPISEKQRVEENKVHGCASQVWLVFEDENKSDSLAIYFNGDSDAQIVKGIVGIMIALFSGLTPDEISKIDAVEILEKLNLSEHLTSQRSNGLKAMVERIHAKARSYKKFT